MFVTFEGGRYKVSFVHHNPMKPHVELPADDTRVEFVGTQCTIQYYAEDNEPKVFVRAWARLHDHSAWEQNFTHLGRRYEQFNKQMGRMISVRRCAKLFFGKEKAEAFIQAYLNDRMVVNHSPTFLGY